MNLYQTLGVIKTATNDEIKKAYRKIAKSCHPDKSSNEEDTERFRKATIAYGVLSDDKRRKRYDETGGYDETDRRSQKEMFRVRGISMLLEAFESIIMAHLLQGEKITSVDMITEVREAIIDKRKKTIESVFKIRGASLQLALSKERLSVKDDGENYLLRKVDDCIEKHKDMLEGAFMFLRILKCTLKELQRYEYRYDPPPKDDGVMDMKMADVMAMMFAMRGGSDMGKFQFTSKNRNEK